MKSESNLQRYILRTAKAQGVFARKLIAPGRRGFPDVMLAYRGYVVFVELKSPTKKGRPSMQQIKEIGRMGEAGLKILIIDSKKGADEIIEKMIRIMLSIES